MRNYDTWKTTNPADAELGNTTQPAETGPDFAAKFAEPFDLRTATRADMIERAEYLEKFPARGRYRADLHAEASALRALAGAP